MVDNPLPNDIDLETFLKSAGQSFTDAQRALVPGIDVSVNMVLSNADLEIKVAVSSDAQGKMSIKPISSEDIVRGGIDPGLLSTIRVSFVSSIGEIKPQPVPATGTATRENPVPVLVGRTLDEAATILKSGGWQFEPHAATSEEVAAAGRESSGRVIRQQPQAGQSVDRAKTTVLVWVNLGNIPVREIDGIGVKLSGCLSDIGINTIGELSLGDVTKVASALSISETRAQAFLDMAALMSRLAILGFKDEVIELLVHGADIHSIEQLADADPKEIYRNCQTALKSGKVRVPREFGFTAEDVKSWIKAAQAYPGK
ncbi:MAG: PASTA domain-containing protein [Dehalococcoidales bacterium]|nr:PASTA domain-containing protein [Dehalococcoidales bacterium]